VNETIGKKQLGYVILFTIVETIILALWLVAANQGLVEIALTVLFLGLFIEHYLAIQAGNFPKSDQVKPQLLSLQLPSLATLKISRSAFILYMGIINGVAAYLASILPTVFPGNMLVPPTIALVTFIANALIVYLMTNAPAPPTAASGA
jgi:hypothetical protein